MTLASKSPVRRETSNIYRGRPLVVKLEARHLEIYEKGRRDVLLVDYSTIYEMALKMRWRRQQAEKKTRRRK